MTVKVIFQISTIALPSIATLGLPFLLMAALGQKVQAATIAPPTEQAEHVECPPGTRYRSSSENKCQPIAAAAQPVLMASASEWTDNPTIPGDGTPQRTEGSGTR